MESVERLIVDMKESLEREIHALGDRLDNRIETGFRAVNERFDNQAARLDRQGALLQTGSRWTNRMNQWAERIDQSLAIKDKQIEELRDRMKKLEKEQSG